MLLPESSEHLPLCAGVYSKLRIPGDGALTVVERAGHPRYPAQARLLGLSLLLLSQLLPLPGAHLPDTI